MLIVLTILLRVLAHSSVLAQISANNGDGHLGLVVVILVDGRPQRVQRLGEFLVRVRLDRERLGHRQHLQIK